MLVLLAILSASTIALICSAMPSTSACRIHGMETSFKCFNHDLQHLNAIIILQTSSDFSPSSGCFGWTILAPMDFEPRKVCGNFKNIIVCNVSPPKTQPTTSHRPKFPCFGSMYTGETPADSVAPDSNCIPNIQSDIGLTSCIAASNYSSVKSGVHFQNVWKKGHLPFRECLPNLNSCANMSLRSRVSRHPFVACLTLFGDAGQSALNAKTWRNGRSLPQLSKKKTLKHSESWKHPAKVHLVGAHRQSCQKQQTVAQESLAHNSFIVGSC